jgi:hypothetical protein
MPRFSDVFVYETVTPSSPDGRVASYINCFLLKRVDGEAHPPGKKFDAIIFDLEGMVLFMVVGEERFGPVVLTTPTTVV